MKLLVRMNTPQGVKDQYIEVTFDRPEIWACPGCGLIHSLDLLNADNIIEIEFSCRTVDDPLAVKCDYRTLVKKDV